MLGRLKTITITIKISQEHRENFLVGYGYRICMNFNSHHGKKNLRIVQPVTENSSSKKHLCIVQPVTENA